MNDERPHRVRRPPLGPSTSPRLVDFAHMGTYAYILSTAYRVCLLDVPLAAQEWNTCIRTRTTPVLRATGRSPPPRAANPPAARRGDRRPGRTHEVRVWPLQKGVGEGRGKLPLQRPHPEMLQTRPAGPAPAARGGGEPYCGGGQRSARPATAPRSDVMVP